MEVTDQVLDAMIVQVEEHAEAEGWDLPSKVIALMDPLTVSMLALEKPEMEEAADNPDMLLAGTVLGEVGGSPHDFLNELVAPAWAIGVVVTFEAWGYPKDVDPGLKKVMLPTDFENRSELRMVVAAMRDGRVRWMERERGKDPMMVESPPRDSRILSMLLRSLALPTPAPAEPVEELAGRLWLARATEWVEECVRSGTPVRVDFTDVHLLSPAGEVPALEGDEDLEGILELGWEGFRSLAMEGRVEDLSPSEATWLDVGSFARMLLSSVPDATESLATLEALLGEHATSTIMAVLTQKGWLPKE